MICYSLNRLFFMSVSLLDGLQLSVEKFQGSGSLCEYPPFIAQWV